MLEHAQLINLLAGRNDPLWICSIADGARVALGCSTGAVYLSRLSAAHILSGHNDINTFDILLLPVAITKGELFLEVTERQGVCAVYREPKGRIFFVSMKVAAKGHELWVSSMYRLTEKKLKKKMLRNKKI